MIPISYKQARPSLALVLFVVQSCASSPSKHGAFQEFQKKKYTLFVYSFISWKHLPVNASLLWQNRETVWEA